MLFFPIPEVGAQRTPILGAPTYCNVNIERPISARLQIGEAAF